MNVEVKSIIEKGDLISLKRSKINSHITLLELLKFSASQPHLQVFMYLFNFKVKNLVINNSICLSIATEATKHNQLNNLKYTVKKFKLLNKIKEIPFPVSHSLVSIAIHNGNKEFIQYFHDIGYKFVFNDIIECVKHNKMKIIKFIINASNINIKDNVDELFRLASEHGNIDILDYLIHAYNIDCKDCKDCKDCINHAIKYKQHDTAKFLIKKLKADINPEHIYLTVKCKPNYKNIKDRKEYNEFLKYLFNICNSNKSNLENLYWLDIINI